MAPANQVVQEEASLNSDEAEQLGLIAQLVLAKQATFDKPAKNRHMRPLYLRGYVNGKPLTKMFVDGGAAVNVMPYTMLTVYFGTPSIFITLWFGFDYGTNPPLGTLII
jgi:hypothetical protein